MAADVDKNTRDTRNEKTLIVGVLGVGKTTLAVSALEDYQRAIVVTTFGKDFPLRVVDSIQLIAEHDKITFENDDNFLNEVAIAVAYEKGDGLLIIDEAHLYQQSEILSKVIRYSRHKNLDVILISHSFFDFARLNRHLIDNILVMQMTDDRGNGDPYELSYIERFYPLGVRDLKKFEFRVVKGGFPKWLQAEEVRDDVYKLIMNKE